MTTTLYGVLAEFSSSQDLLTAIHGMHKHDVTDLEAYTPYPVEELTELLPIKPNKVPLFTLIGGLAGGIGGYFMQWYTAVISFPVNTGGRPLHSWPMFIPISFELTILCAALAAVLAMLMGNGLPQLHHPLFDAPGFDLATRNRFFLCVRIRTDDVDSNTLQQQLAELAAVSVVEVAL